MDLTDSLSSEERLAILRDGDKLRSWRKLDERRVCTCCMRVFTGEEIRISKEANGSCHLSCPSDGCGSSPSDWFFYGSGLALGSSTLDPQPEIEFDLGQ